GIVRFGVREVFSSVLLRTFGASPSPSWRFFVCIDVRRFTVVFLRTDFSVHSAFRGFLCMFRRTREVFFWKKAQPGPIPAACRKPGCEMKAERPWLRPFHYLCQTDCV